MSADCSEWSFHNVMFIVRLTRSCDDSASYSLKLIRSHENIISAQVASFVQFALPSLVSGREIKA